MIYHKINLSDEPQKSYASNNSNVFITINNRKGKNIDVKNNCETIFFWNMID